MKFLWLCAALTVLPGTGSAQTVDSAAQGVHAAGKTHLKMDSFFKALQRPSSPNHWLVAPAGFVVPPDAVAPVFAVTLPVLQSALKTVVRQTRGAVIAAETVDGLHVVFTSAIFGFRDDIRVQFIGITPQQSTLALYSASRVGYWDLGANRRRVDDWLVRLQIALSAPNP